MFLTRGFPRGRKGLSSFDTEPSSVQGVLSARELSLFLMVFYWAPGFLSSQEERETVLYMAKPSEVCMLRH